MKTFFRKGVTLLLLAVLVLSLLTLSGCHGSKERAGFSVPAEFDTSRNYEISFWAKNDTNLTQVAIYQQAIADFEALYPNIKVNLRLYTDYGRIYNDVITNISTDTTPNVCITYPDHIATYMTGSDVVVPLDELFADANYGFGGTALRYDGPAADELIERFMAECAIGGVHYAIPFMRSTEACYINKTYVEQLGYTIPEDLTWDFIWEVSEAAMAKNEDGTYKLNGQNVMIPFIYKSTDNMMIQMLRQLDAGYSDEDGNIAIFNDETRALLLHLAGEVKLGTFSTFAISSYPANFFNAGQCLFGIDSTAGATWMGSDAPLLDISAENLVQFETVVKPIPQFDPENPQMISQGPSLCVFNKADSQEVLASWLFAQFMLTNSVQTAYAETEGYAPVTLKAQQSEAYQSYLAAAGTDNDLHYSVKIDCTRLLMDNVEHTFTTPVFNGSASLRNAAGQMIENVTKSVRRKEVVDNAYIDKLYESMNSLYRLDQVTGANAGTAMDLGPLPGTAVALLYSLAAAWALMGLYVLLRFLHKAARKK